MRRSILLQAGVKILYHATLADNLDSIAEDGLLLSRDPNWGGMLGQESVGKVFLATTPQAALYYGLILFREKLEMVGEAPIPFCLRVHLPTDVEIEAPKPEYGVPSKERIISREIPPQNIEVWYHNWRPLIGTSEWNQYRVSLDEEENVYQDWEGAPVGESVAEALADTKAFVTPKRR